MADDYHIPVPFQFNPMKHHLDYIRNFVINKSGKGISGNILRDIRKIGSSVMDIYAGELSPDQIFSEIHEFLKGNGITGSESFGTLTGKSFSDLLIVRLFDGSQWVLKYHDSPERYVHIFPARSGPHTFRVKSNTLKSAVLYEILIGKDYVTEEDLNKARSIARLSPIKEVAESRAISEMIEILRQHHLSA
jgi:hypothetical protein